jgi:thiol-disulfide isomerase/thioredoxin
MKKILFSLLIVMPQLLSCSRVSDHFTIIGKTTGFRDSTRLYLQDSKSTSLLDNIDSTYIINNSFTFKGSVSEPKLLIIHTGYTGWQNQPPESFYMVSFFVSNSTIYLNDDIGNLKFSKFSGSELQNDNTDLIQMNKPFILKLDSINKGMMKLNPSDSLMYKILQKEFQKAYEANQQSTVVFIEKHPKSILSAVNLNIFKELYGKEKTKYLYNLLDPKIRNFKDSKSIEDYIQLQYTKNFGDLVDIELPNLKGELIKLSSLKGKYILLEFWASSCGPCRAENPELLKLYNLYKEKGFEIYAVSLDEDKERWQEAVKDDKISWITVSDLKGSSNSKVAMTYEVTGIPKNYLIDREGKIIAQDIRGDKLTLKLKDIFTNK